MLVASWRSRECGLVQVKRKRISLALQRPLLEEAKRILGTTTYSAAVNIALAEIIHVRKATSMSTFFGQQLWQGDLSDMREDKPTKRPRKRKQ
jgi:hypothetical protein